MRMRVVVVLGAMLVVLGMSSSTMAQTGVGAGGGTPGTARNFQLVGHDALFGRGMNAALALYTDPGTGKTFVYVGNRTDGSSTCGVGDPRPGPCPHPHPGILIENVSDPANPVNVGEIGPPYAGNVGITTRELRVWPQKKLLMVMSFRCSSQLHACPVGTDATFPFDIKFFSLADPVHPRFIGSYVTKSKAGVAIKPHEMYLWVDPHNANRALLWQSTPATSVDPNRPELVIADLSRVPGSVPGPNPAPLSTVAPVREVAEGNWNQLFPGADNPANYDNDLSLHSMAPTADGKRTYMAYLRGGNLVLDTSKVVSANHRHGQVISLNDSLLTPIANRATWGAGNQCAGHTALGCSESHSAVPVPGRPFELSTDEVYGTFTTPSFGSPWGWSRLINVANPVAPSIVGEYKIFQDTAAFQGSPNDDAVTEQFRSYSSHNPTVTPDLALIDWHSGGLQALDISNPSAPSQAGWFTPTPLPSVANEDPALSQGNDRAGNKVVMWSYPIINNGLIYVVDIRNGLYILRYTGSHAKQIRSLRFLEGNSNLGDAVELANPGEENGHANGMPAAINR
jgi:hypothetical protein